MDAGLSEYVFNRNYDYQPNDILERQSFLHYSVETIQVSIFQHPRWLGEENPIRGSSKWKKVKISVA